MIITVLFRDPVTGNGIQDGFVDLDTACDYINGQMMLWKTGKNPKFPATGWQMQITVEP